MGTGQFRPGATANPSIGNVGELEEIQEARVETLCLGEDVVRKAIKALKRSVLKDFYSFQPPSFNPNLPYYLA